MRVSYSGNTRPCHGRDRGSIPLTRSVITTRNGRPAVTSVTPTSLPMVDGEEHIVRAAIRGEASAFGTLYDRYQPAIYRFVLFKVGRREDAEDLTHQIFIKAWQRIDQYEGRGFPFSSWLYRIARNQIVDFYRSHRETTSIDELDVVLASTPTLEHDIDTRLDARRIRTVMTQLKPEYQDVIILRFIEECSVEDTATALNRSQGAVKVLQHRALAQLRTLLNAAEHTNSHEPPYGTQLA